MLRSKLPFVDSSREHVMTSAKPALRAWGSIGDRLKVMDEEARAVKPKRGFHKMKQKKTARFSNSDSNVSALKVPDSKQSSQIVTATLERQQKEGHMNTNTTKRTKKTTAKAHTLGTCTTCQAEYKAEAWHTETLCPTCYKKAHPKAEKAESTTAQKVAKTVGAIALAVLITKGTYYAVSVVDTQTGADVSKVYTLKTHGEALTLAEQMFHDRKLADILDATPEAEIVTIEAIKAGE